MSNFLENNKTKQVSETPPNSIPIKNKAVRKFISDTTIKLPLSVRLETKEYSYSQILNLKEVDYFESGVGNKDIFTLWLDTKPLAEGKIICVKGKYYFKIKKIFNLRGDL